MPALPNRKAEPKGSRHERVFLSGDLALQRAIRRAYGFDQQPTDGDVTQVSDRWRPYRSLAARYLFASEYDGVP